MNNEIKPIVIRAELHYPKWVRGPEGPATYDLAINEKGELENLTAHYNKNNLWQNYITVRGCGFDRIWFYINKNIVKNDECFTYTVLNDLF